ncbi:MAG: hypothetical protein R3B81_05000 [bacterium]
MPYADQARQHLSNYKRQTLRVLEDGEWRKQGPKYSHILPDWEGGLNLLEPFREEMNTYLSARVKKHRGFHHLNSSQAMALNLFYPALQSAPMQRCLTQALADSDRTIADWHFEWVADSKEGTNFDLHLELDTGENVYVEVKFTESSFGTASEKRTDGAYQAKLDGIYRDRLADKVIPEFLELDAFCRHYQLLRNISYAGSGSRVVFVVPAGNTSAQRHARQVLDHALLPGVSGISLVTVEKIHEALAAAAVEDARLDLHYRQFKDKYLWGDTEK